MLGRIYKETGLRYESIWDIEWREVSRVKNLSEDFIEKFQDDISWETLTRNRDLTEDFISTYKINLDWNYISKYKTLSEDFIREYKDYVNWSRISSYQKLSDKFIMNFKHSVKWVGISVWQKLSEDFIEANKDCVDWELICKYQKLSENFIRNNINLVNLNIVRDYQTLSPEFVKEFDIKFNENNWLYKDSDFKKKKVLETGLYECHDDYFIAYKNIRKDRYSHYNFQYQYLKGETYECHCDTTETENSFGLSVWTKDKAENYHDNGIIVKVKIKYEDVGRVVHEGGKIRCFKFEVLE